MEKKKYRLNNELLKRKPHFFLIGLVVSLSTLLLAFEWTTVKTKINIPVSQPAAAVVDELPPVTFVKKNQIERPVSKQAVDRSRLAVEPIAVFTAAKNEEPKLAESTNSTIIAIPENNSDGFDEEKPVEEIVPSWTLSKMPEFPGGESERLRFLAENIRYPDAAKRFNQSGIVYVQFVVDTDGSLSGIKVIQSASPELDAEALRVVRAMPDWIPGQQGVNKVRVRYVQKIEFKLL